MEPPRQQGPVQLTDALIESFKPALVFKNFVSFPPCTITDRVCVCVRQKK